ncbi:NHL repeat-containing protein [Aporhodopirellula aestuarii]|uniref:Uncharacterized protein n=1 Tax=Aporhodopirellula aestuarii TaxID=2950107 RepID=A0ABT0U7D9_9BACT|nr:hypothetical protein [Aporhodopirellula aestuarii]MCM2372722.1 hypothetical protein [Aporhodopirellula aestuarii]
MNYRNPGSVLAPLWIMLAVLILGGVSVVVMRMESLTRSENSFALDVSRHTDIAEPLLHYSEAAPIALPLSDAHAFAVSPNGDMVVCGESSVWVLDAEGVVLQTLAPVVKPRCVAVAGKDHPQAGRIYVAGNNAIEIFSADGESIARWDVVGKLPLLTSISLTNENVYVADAGNQTVIVFDDDGIQTGVIGAEFVVPSGYFDVVAEDNGLVHVVNPGARRVETYSVDGDREAVWGQAGSGMEDFFGCCNPAHIAMLPGGRFVTSEKGIPRIKVYDDSGKLQSVVAGTEQLLRRQSRGDEVLSGDVFDIAVDDEQRILVLDPTADQIRTFIRTQKKAI